MKGEMWAHSGCSVKQLGSFLLRLQENPVFWSLPMFYCFLYPAFSGFCATLPAGKNCQGLNRCWTHPQRSHPKPSSPDRVALIPEVRADPSSSTEFPAQGPFGDPWCPASLALQGPSQPMLISLVPQRNQETSLSSALTDVSAHCCRQGGSAFDPSLACFQIGCLSLRPSQVTGRHLWLSSVWPPLASLFPASLAQDGPQGLTPATLGRGSSLF